MIIDCHDPESLARFWCELLDLAVVDRLGQPPSVRRLRRQRGCDLTLGFQCVPENKNVKNRVQLDLEVDDVEAVTSWIEANAGGRAGADDDEEHGYRLRVMRDPEGTEFCPWFPTGSRV